MATTTYSFIEAAGADIFYDASATDFFDNYNTNLASYDKLFNATTTWKFALNQTWTITDDADATIFTLSEANYLATFKGAIAVDDTTESTSTTTGSIQTDGGLGVAGDIYAGDDIFLTAAGVLNWGAGDVTLTGGTNLLTLAGGDLNIALNADIEGYAAIGDGVALSAARTLRVDRDYTVTSGNAEQIGVGGVITVTGGGGDLHGGMLINPGGVIINSGSGHNVYTLRVLEPNITVTSGTAHVGVTIYAQNASTEATSNYAIWADDGINRLDAGVIIGATTSQDNQIDDSTNSGASTTLYIGNETIDTTASDESLKQKFQAFDAGPNRVMLLQLADALKTYEYRGRRAGRFAGYGAHALDTLFPQFVRKPSADEDGGPVPANGWSVDYKYMVPNLIGGFADHEARLAALEAA